MVGEKLKIKFCLYRGSKLMNNFKIFSINIVLSNQKRYFLKKIDLGPFQRRHNTFSTSIFTSSAVYRVKIIHYNLPSINKQCIN